MKSRLLDGAIALATFLAVALMIAKAPQNWLNADRLLPLFMLRDGISPYPALNAGLMANAMYPPLSFLVYAPVLLFHTPWTVVGVAGLLAQIFALLPVLLALKFAAAAPHRNSTVILLFGVFVLYTQLSPVLQTLRWVHADAPALFCSAMACFCTLRAIRGNALLWAAGAGVLCALAPWIKQLGVPAAALPFLVFLACGAYRLLVAYCLTLGLTTATLLAVFQQWFGLRQIFFWTVTLPGRHAWKGVWSTILPGAHDDLMRETIFCLALLLMSLGAVVKDYRQSGSLRSLLMREPWLVYFGAAILFWPISIRGAILIGSSINNYLYAIYFVFLAALVKLAGLLEDQETSPAAAAGTRAFLLAFLACLSVTVGIDFGKNVLSPKRVLNSNEYTVYRFSQRHPGLVYFPMNTLSVYLAEGKFYNFDISVDDRQRGGVTIDRSLYRSYLPPHAQYVAYSGQLPMATFLVLDVDKTDPQSLPELPEWVIYRLPPP